MVQISQIPGNIICGFIGCGSLIPWGWGWLDRFVSFAIPKLRGCVTMAKIHQNRHGDLRFLLQIRRERRKILIATQPGSEESGYRSDGFSLCSGRMLRLTAQHDNKTGQFESTVTVYHLWFRRSTRGEDCHRHRSQRHSSHSQLNLWVLFAQQPAKGCGFLPSQE